MNLKYVYLAGAFASLMATGASAATVTAISSEAQVTAVAQVGAVSNTETGIDGFAGAVPSDYAVFAGAGALDQGASVYAGGAMSASFASASMGSLELADMGWETVSVNSGLADLTDGAGTSFSYTFSVDAATTMSIDLDVVVDPMTTNAFGLNGVSLGAIGDFGGMSYSDAFDPSVSENIFVNLDAGVHTLSLTVLANINGNIATRTAFFDGTLDWDIATAAVAPVPLPAGMALMLSALGLMGAARLRKS